MKIEHRVGFSQKTFFLFHHHLIPNHCLRWTLLNACSATVTIVVIEHILIGRTGDFHGDAVFYAFGTGETHRIRNYIFGTYLNACFALYTMSIIYYRNFGLFYFNAGFCHNS
jgi:hypothetical protein